MTPPRVARRVRCRRCRPAQALIYVLVCFPLFIAMAALAVDAARMRLTKLELQCAADAAARYAARGMQTSSTPMTTARAHAAAVVADARADGDVPTCTTADVVRGTFDPQTRAFTPDGVGDAVSVTVRQSLNRPGGIPLIISALIGDRQTDLAATAVARVVSVATQIQPPASGNLWLSGMPANTTTDNFRPDNPAVWDDSGTAASGTGAKQRPLEVQLGSLSLHPGDSISFEGISGNATYNNQTPDSTTNTADGNVNYVVANGVAPATSAPTNSSNGMSNARAPIGAIMAVFLDDNAPSGSIAPPNLDFGTALQRDYTSISPKLKQVFYIGDGKRANGEAQTIVVPTGATRVFFGMMDAWQWNDNVGDFKTKLYTTSTVQFVK